MSSRALIFSVHPPELHGRHAFMLPEYMAEIAYIVETGFGGDIPQSRVIGGQQKLFRLPEPELRQVLKRPHVESLLEQAAKVLRGYARYAGHIIQSNILAEILFNIGQQRF